MSRPIYEPSLPRADAELGYGNRQLFRRPAPVSEGGATTAALVEELNFDQTGDDEIPSGVWTLVTPGDGTRFWEAGWRRDADWSVNMIGPGNFQRSEFALYVAYASVGFSGIANGDTVGVGIQWSASVNFFYPDLNVAEDGEFRAVTTSPWWGTLTDVRMWCFQNSGVDQAIGLCEFHIRRFELADDGEFLTWGS